MNLEELRLILDAFRAKELRNQKFFAALKGIDLDKETAASAEEEFKRVEQRVQAKLQGKSQEEFEINEFGFDIEKE